MNFCAGMMVGMLVVAVAVEVVVWWRQQGERYGLSKPVQAKHIGVDLAIPGQDVSVVEIKTREDVKHLIDQAQARHDEQKRRRERFAAVTAVEIDLNRIVEIESAGVSSKTGDAGERGLCQILPDTWSDVTREMGVDWSFEDAYDPQKNLAVADWYLRVTLPRYLKHHGIPDTSSARIAAYNHGIGNVNRLWRLHQGYWITNLPNCVKWHLTKYSRAEPKRDYVKTYQVGPVGWSRRH